MDRARPPGNPRQPSRARTRVDRGRSTRTPPARARSADAPPAAAANAPLARRRKAAALARPLLLFALEIVERFRCVQPYDLLGRQDPARLLAGGEAAPARGRGG